LLRAYETAKSLSKTQHLPVNFHSMKTENRGMVRICLDLSHIYDGPDNPLRVYACTAFSRCHSFDSFSDFGVKPRMQLGQWQKGVVADEKPAS
jgi:hypothetical protein